ncbi:hypothetical protein P0082_09955 [Candidatus Haliotispira prima]|uniref:Uncharacterized protein n=1 Tax=Candidatus Haliotispira prima TaxID=3034016 RepID=A0ABY8MI03_9SPIO|nr:hypothetical protein P0082_09955 [Candidatus Haliotispira prima]
MNSEILLTREIEIETWHIQGTIAKAQERKEIMLVLKFLAEPPDNRARDFASELLFVGDDNPRQVVAQRMLALSKLYGLTDEEPSSGVYSLTDKGKEALETKEVFVPEDGCWALSVSNDPLLPHSVIQVASFEESNAFSESIGKDAKSELEKRKQKIKRLPQWIRQVTKLGELSPHVGGKKLRIDSIEDKGEKASPKQSITLEWTVSKNSIRLSDNKLPDNNKKILNQFEGPGLDWNDVWEILLHNEDRLDD